ncbi:hypothetical protein ACN4EG_16165 [Alkalinema pantanalense CENA528]|uniref:hypothetical protein n=1 Tax=Alkalinema pantanalense TaxID=1620705 RepID=UPI003D6E8A95
MNTQLTLKQQFVALPLLTMSLFGLGVGAVTLPAFAGPAEAKQDIVSKLEYCQSLDTPAARQECREKVKKYCAEKYPIPFCKEVFQEFKESQTSLTQPGTGKPIAAIDPKDLVKP